MKDCADQEYQSASELSGSGVFVLLFLYYTVHGNLPSLQAIENTKKDWLDRFVALSQIFLLANFDIRDSLSSRAMMIQMIVTYL